MAGSLFSQLFFWFFVAAPKSYLRIWKNFLVFVSVYFSFFELLKTLCSPWRGIRWQKQSRGLDIGDFASTLFSNLISRLLGAIVRTVLLLAGMLAELIVFGTGFLLFFAWFFVPLIILLGFFYGFSLLFF